MDETIKLNQQIASEIQRHIRFMHRHYAKYDIQSPEKQALQILKDHYLIQLPIPDSDWGGAIRELPNGQKVPVINTSQPRLYQYFIYWHEIFHLIEEPLSSVSHEISTEFDLTERKADYFASQMLIGKDLYFYFLDSIEEKFIERAAKCMDTFKAPYKAILIQLYESAIEYQNETLQEEIRENFDIAISREEWIELFKTLSLDENLVKPSHKVDFGLLKHLAEKEHIKNPEDRVFHETRNFIFELERKYLDVKGKLESGEL
ncbi:MAG: ImmA/IrrE family metallo-endopeptidase [Bacillota bacterium]